MARRHLAPGGVLIADVPNALSLHRRLGVKLGMLATVTDLNDADRAIGHQRVYTPDSLRADVEQAGFTVVRSGGVFLKVLANAQTEAVFDGEQLRGFLELGADMPELAAEIFIVARSDVAA